MKRSAFYFVFVLTALLISCGPSADQMEQARKMSAEQNHEEAIRLYTIAIESDGRDPEPWHQRGVERMKIGRLQDAEADLTYAIMLDGNKSESYYQRAVVRFKTGKNKESMDDINKAIQLEKGSADYYLFRSVLLALKGSNREGVLDLDYAISIQPSSALLYYYRGRMQQRCNEPDEAIRDYSQALKLDGKNHLYYHWRGRAYISKTDMKAAESDLAEALNQVNKATRKYPDSSLLYYYTGYYKAQLAGLFTKKSYEKYRTSCLEDFEKGSEVSATSGLEYYLLAEALFYLGDYAAAEQEFMNSIESQVASTEDLVNEASAWLGLGNCAFGRGDYETAVTNYTRCIELEGGDISTAYSNRAWCKYKKNDRDGACADYKIAIAMGDPSAEEALDHIGCSKTVVKK
jgi:tetratricopeptide (TPR) repeat protein